MDDLISRQAVLELPRDVERTLSGEVVSEMVDIKLIEALPSAQPEVTEEAIKEYCRKRCLCIVDSALLKKYAYAQPEITRCKECRFSEYDAMYNDRYCHHNGKAEIVEDEHYCGYGKRRPE